MTLKIAPASPEEYVFAQECNRLLTGTGASVHAFTQVDGDKQPAGYGLVMQCGGKRETITADTPFSYDPPEDVVRRVKQWVASAGQADRWTTDLEKTDGSAAT
jgi:hypothetical protein